MTHPSEDILLGFALETIDDPSESAAVASHLAGCRRCSDLLAGIRRDLAILGGLEPRGRVLGRPLVRRRLVPAIGLLQAAALLTIGFALGLGAAARSHREQAWVSPAYLSVSPPADSLRLLAVPDATAALSEGAAFAPR
ncbi:MAG: hypothetical protein QUU85_18595 [Candidatus Eisenbacteria bacterium]|nr:hypothetical protein [Candidatus Eisenbacteria bacterium]